MFAYEISIDIVNLAAMKFILAQVRTEECLVIISRHEANFLTVDLVRDFQG